MDGAVQLGSVLVLLLAAGGALALTDPKRFAPRWLLAAALLVALNDALLTRCYGLVPDMVPGHWAWQGKAMALAATLAIAALPAFGLRDAGLTVAQAKGSLRTALPVAACYAAFFAVLALALPNEPVRGEDIAFQLTMPGLEEEAFYRGLLLLALDRAFTGRVRLLGVEWGWGAMLSCALFGLAHALAYADGGFSLDPQVMALTMLPSFVAVWLRLRTGSVLLPVVLHNLGNSASLLL